MPLKRVLEPEVMDTVEEAVDYNSMDHSEVNQQFVKDLLQFANESGIHTFSKVLDLGTGTALIPIELCKADSNCNVVAIDMAEQMLILARENVNGAGFEDRIELQMADAKGLQFPDGTFPCVMSNSIIHHIPEPARCVSEMIRATVNGGVIFVRDLMRPDSDEWVDKIVETYAGSENAHSQKLFDDSLRAALSLEEMQSLVESFGFERSTVAASSDRHWTWAAVKKD